MDQAIFKEYLNKITDFNKQLDLKNQELEELRPFGKNLSKILQNRKAFLSILLDSKSIIIKIISLYREDKVESETYFEMLSMTVETEHEIEYQIKIIKEILANSDHI